MSSSKLHGHEEIQIVKIHLVLPHLFALLHSAVDHRCGVPGSFAEYPVLSELKTSLFSKCIDAQESTTNSRSSGFFEVGAGIAHGFNEESKT